MWSEPKSKMGQVPDLPGLEQGTPERPHPGPVAMPVSRTACSLGPASRAPGSLRPGPHPHPCGAPVCALRPAPPPVCASGPAAHPLPRAPPQRGACHLSPHPGAVHPGGGRAPRSQPAGVPAPRAPPPGPAGPPAARSASRPRALRRESRARRRQGRLAPRRATRGDPGPGSCGTGRRLLASPEPHWAGRGLGAGISWGAGQETRGLGTGAPQPPAADLRTLLRQDSCSYVAPAFLESRNQETPPPRKTGPKGAGKI